MTLFKDTYRIESTRHPDWDYSSAGCYFVTICACGSVQTRGIPSPFGEVVDCEMRLSPIGEIVRTFWLQIPNHHSHVTLDAFVVMPNHVHGIIVIGTPPPVETRNFASLQPANTNQFGPLKRGSLQAIIHSYKAAVTRSCNCNSETAFKWQPRYYEHIIRTKASLNKIRAYIHSNPTNWAEDELNRENADR